MTRVYKRNAAIEAAAAINSGSYVSDTVISNMMEDNDRLREALVTLLHFCEKSRIWGGMEWVYHPVHPVHYLPALELARAALGVRE